ncbi:retrovirus-related pol polyprotein from transposon TNT 1-94 [Tanacetum coccineum]
MDSMIPLGQKNTLAEYMILSGADNRPPMLDKDLYDSWKIRMELYMQNREHRRMILESVENGPLIWPTVEENGVTRTKKYAELSATEKIQADCDMKATNIILQGLPADIYSLIPQGSPQPIINLELHQIQEIIQDGRVTVQQVKGRQGQSYFGIGYKSNDTSSGGNNASGHARVVKCYNCQREGHMARQFTQPKRPRNAAWYKDKAMLAEAQEAGQILDEEQLPFLADPGTEDLGTYDFDSDDISNEKDVLMANISNYGSDIISEVPNSETYLNDIENQSVHAMQDFEQIPAVDVTDNEITTKLQDKDTTICKLKDIIKSIREKSKEENVNYDYGEIETKNVELENSVAKLILENKRLANEINHVKQVFKEQFDSIKKTRVRTNEHKRKEIVDIAAQIPSANTIVPGMFKLDLEPLAPRLLQNREAHIDYLKYTQEQADILWEIFEQAKAKQPLDKELDFSCKHAKRIKELLVYVRDTCQYENKLSAKKVVVTPKNNVKKLGLLNLSHPQATLNR